MIQRGSRHDGGDHLRLAKTRARAIQTSCLVGHYSTVQYRGRSALQQRDQVGYEKMPSHRPSKNRCRLDLTPYRTQQRHQQRTAEPSSRTPPNGRHQSYNCLPRNASETEPFEPYPVTSTLRRGGEDLSPVRSGSCEQDTHSSSGIPFSISSSNHVSVSVSRSPLR